ncbi:uncharacterized protein LOC128548459 [Mercenaria mercenaria]|uniref:uncharacterized protein LOC128548459 n=1 Tax=Mercenaria mercenaria TaxID=6596 RepID=UPI00234E8A60|nr:uncharacterized protein LOC128548459 [Mercenaria mercenaria]
MSNSADQSMSANELMQAMLQQQALLMNTLKTMQSSSSNDKEKVILSDTDSVENPESVVRKNVGNVKDTAPACYDLEEVSSESEEDSADEFEGLADMKKLYDESDSVGEKIHDKLACNVSLSFRKRLLKEDQTAMMEKFKRPENCESMTVPKVNVVVWDEAKAHVRVRDINLAKEQNMILKASIPITQMAQKCLSKKKQEIRVSQCTDALVLLSAAFIELIFTRRENFKMSMSNQYRSRAALRMSLQQIGFLRDDLAKRMKEIQDTKSVSEKLVMCRDHEFSKYRSRPFYEKRKDSKKEK